MEQVHRKEGIRTELNLREVRDQRSTIHCSLDTRTLDHVGPESRSQNARRKSSMSEEELQQQPSSLDSC